MVPRTSNNGATSTSPAAAPAQSLQRPPAASRPGAAAPGECPPVRPRPAASCDPRGHQARRGGFRPSSSLPRGSTAAHAALEEQPGGTEAETARTVRPGSWTRHTALRVDCPSFAPPTSGAWHSQPITPSPHSLPTLHDNCSAGSIPTVPAKRDRCASANDFGCEGDRIGDDGMAQTPSAQQSTPTASSRGHPMKRKGVPSPATLSSPGAFHRSRLDPARCGFSMPGAAASDAPASRTYSWSGGPKSRRAEASGAEPVGALQRASTAAADDDARMLDVGRETDAREVTAGGTPAHRPPPPGGGAPTPSRGRLPPPRFQRCSSWSPGLTPPPPRRGDPEGGARPCGARTLDPVACQLLRLCVFHEEERLGREAAACATSSPAVERLPTSGVARSSGGDCAVCRSPLPPAGHGPSSFSASTPHLLRLSPLPATATQEWGGRKGTPGIAEGAAVEYPLSPLPLFRDLSNRLRDVKTEDDIKSLARPVPRKLT